MRTSRADTSSAATRSAAGESLTDWWQLPLLAIVAGLSLLTLSSIQLARGAEPFSTWYYIFAWYPVLLAGDGVVALTGGAGRRGAFLLLGRKGFLLTLLAWSAVVWLFYEVFNFRLQNWYYVFVPENRLERWSGMLIAFATVLPAVFVAEAILAGLGVAASTRWRTFRVTPAALRWMRVAGAIMVALVLAWPRYFFPLVWGATMLLIEPTVYQKSRAHSLLGDLEDGRPGRMLRLLLGGAFVGLVWETLNVHARAKWIYTVPFLEETWLFEMPLPGFFGFPPFAVECFILWQALVLAGLAVPRRGGPRPAPLRRRVLAGFGAAAFGVAVLLGMEQMTVDSRTPELSEVAPDGAPVLAAAGHDVFTLSRESPAAIARLAHGDTARAAMWITRAQLATLRGIGSNNLEQLWTVGVRSIRDLADADAHELVRVLESAHGVDLVDARVRVWVRGARRHGAAAQSAPVDVPNDAAALR